MISMLLSEVVKSRKERQVGAQWDVAVSHFHASGRISLNFGLSAAALETIYPTEQRG